MRTPAAIAVTARIATHDRFSRRRSGVGARVDTGPAYRQGFQLPAVRPVAEPVDELQTLEVLAHRGALVVDEPGVQPGPLYRPEVEVGRDGGCLLRPGDPE